MMEDGRPSDSSTGDHGLPKPRDITSAILEGSTIAATHFRREFSTEIDRIALAASEALRAVRSFEREAPSTGRVDAVSLFLVLSIDSALTSSHLLLRGLFSASQHAMRQNLESVAMAAILSSSELNVYERFVRDRDRFSVTKAVAGIGGKRKLRALGWPAEFADSFLELRGKLSAYSHPTIGAASWLFPSEKFGLRALLGHFDPKMVGRYRHELELCAASLDMTPGLAKECLGRVASDNPAGTDTF
jgi:hypothetical protein